MCLLYASQGEASVGKDFKGFGGREFVSVPVMQLACWMHDENKTFFLLSLSIFKSTQGTKSTDADTNVRGEAHQKWKH